MIVFTEIILNLLKLAAGLSASIRWTVSPGIIFQGLAAGRVQPAEAAASSSLTAASLLLQCCSAADPHQTRDKRWQEVRGNKECSVLSPTWYLIPWSFSQDSNLRQKGEMEGIWNRKELEMIVFLFFFLNYEWTNLWGSGELEEVHGILLVILHVAQRLLGLGLSCGLLLGLRLLLLILLLLQMKIQSQISFFCCLFRSNRHKAYASVNLFKKFSLLLFAILSFWETFWWRNPHNVFLTIWFCLGAGINPAMTNLVCQSGLLLGNDFFVGFDGFVNLGIILRGLNYGLTSHFIRDFHCVYYSQFSTRYASRLRSRTRLKGGVDSSTGPGLGCRARRRAGGVTHSRGLEPKRRRYCGSQNWACVSLN